MNKIPIPYFNRVLETHEPGPGTTVLVCPDPMAGKARRYSVILLDRMAGQVECIGRELPLAAARKVAVPSSGGRVMPQVISGFPGIGKSHFYTHECRDLKVSDSDSSKFSWVRPGERHPDFPQNYMQHIKTLLGEVDVVLVSSHKEVRDALVAAEVEFTLVYPERGAKEQYLERYRQRGSDAAFLALLDQKWDEFLDEMETQTNCTRIELHPGQYLSDVLEGTQ